MKRVALIALALLAPMLAHGASFDCGKSVTKMERLICSDRQLSSLDEELTATYAQALKESTDPTAIKKQQREWLADVRKRCEDVACLKNEFSLQMTQLASGKNSAKQEHAPIVIQDEAAQSSTKELYNTIGVCTVSPTFAKMAIVLPPTDSPPEDSGQPSKIAKQRNLDSKQPRQNDESYDAKRRAEEEKERKARDEETIAYNKTVRCNNARQQLGVLKTQRPVFHYDNAGNQVYLEDEQRGSKIAEAEQRVAAECR